MEETLLSGGGPGIPGSVSPLHVGISLGCPGSQGDPTTVRRQMCFPPEMDYRSEPLQSPPPHAARAAAAAGVAFTGKSELSTPQPPARPLPLHATAATEDLI